MRVSPFAAVASLLLLAFCNENSAKNGAAATGASEASAPTAKAPVALGPAEEAKDLFANRCAMCHGQNGAGDGPSAATLNPKPRDFGSKEWQKSVTDAQLHTVILAGGPSVGKSPLMPPNPDLMNKPAVVDELAKIVRGFGSPPSGGGATRK